ncbi:hypothetical protein PLICRDRAFT_45367 [Plicaturopsis crispa FD-325 SS-3]|uniref:F-box domain-containing protein n=1 Tax=Plicaturopsis crispa FD-325 SS-3 TaxID=944288 RepID=A0A0C9SS23_PLICR|nr:hypothetical protein PLICRDRAFT_45367 [Plicaturopsis crispa FD-325 SS-3]
MGFNRMASRLSLERTHRKAEMRNTKSALEGLPLDIFHDIAQNIPDANDILSLSLTCRRSYMLLLPDLYECVDLKSTQHCVEVLSQLLGVRSELSLARQIRKLVVRPNSEVAAVRSQTPDADAMRIEWHVAALIKALAQRGDLFNLREFCWDGLEAPRFVWTALREGCPKLRTVMTTFGVHPLDRCDSLFEFDNLVGFGLFDRKSSDAHLVTVVVDRVVNTIPDKCWDMLFRRCPNLRTFIIDGKHPPCYAFDLAPLVDAHWPSLRHFTLGKFVCLNKSSNSLTQDCIPAFMTRHAHTLETYTRHHLTGPFGVLSTQLPNLRTFVGALNAHIFRFRNVRAIEGTNCVPLRQADFPLLVHALSSLTSLERLYIAVSDGDTDDWLRQLLSSCSKLKHLDLDVRCKRFTFREFTDALESWSPPSLRFFSLAKTHQFTDEPLTGVAARVAVQCPVINGFRLTVRARKQPREVHRKTMHALQEGTYTVERDGQPNAVFLNVDEVRHWRLHERIAMDVPRKFKLKLA